MPRGSKPLDRPWRKIQAEYEDPERIITNTDLAKKYAIAPRTLDYHARTKKWLSVHKVRRKVKEQLSKTNEEAEDAIVAELTARAILLKKHAFDGADIGLKKW